MNIKELINNNSIYILFGLSIACLILFLFFFILLIKQYKLNKKYKKFMSGMDASSLENIIMNRFSEIDLLKENDKQIKSDLSKVNENLLITFQKVGINKYDAFKEMGGKLSFVLALLDKNNNGFLINSVHSSREGCYIYLKEIIKGESFLELSADEKKALIQAINSSNYME